MASIASAFVNPFRQSFRYVQRQAHENPVITYAMAVGAVGEFLQCCADTPGYLLIESRPTFSAALQAHSLSSSSRPSARSWATFLPQDRLQLIHVRALAYYNIRVVKLHAESPYIPVLFAFDSTTT